ncbi:cation transporter [bacterium]|nr:cation transporter [bacterium]
MQINKKKKLVAELSILSNIFLTVLKIIVGVISGSISIISEAIHSMSDLFASVITFFSVVKSAEPADKDHPYGHGKYEDMSGFIEGLLIIGAAIFIVYESSKKIIFNTSMEPNNNLGIAVMCIAVVMNIFVSSIIFKTAKESNSISLYADAQHLRTDVYCSAGVFIGLILIKITGYSILDSIIAILVAMVIYSAGYKICKQSLMNLLDHSLPTEDLEKIKQIIENCSNVIVLKKDGIKARQVGPTKDIDIVLQFPQNTSICSCHKICDEIEKKIQSVYLNSSISIHSEPICYNADCEKSCNNEYCKNNV